MTTDFAGDSDLANAVTIQGDGKIVAVGEAFISGASGFALARYKADGSLDTTFDTDGLVTTDFGNGCCGALAVAIQGDGKIVAAGDVFGEGIDFGLDRYNPDGSLDATFDTDGLVTTAFGEGCCGAQGVAIQGDGRIVAAGYAYFSGNARFALVRYNTDGSPDPAFGTGGKVTTDFTGSDDLAYGVAMQANGRVVAAGVVSFFSESADFALARYNTDGSLDPTFSGDGKVTTDFAGSEDQANAVAIQANGRIVAAGLAAVSGTYDFSLARYTCFRRTSRPSSIPFCP